MPKLVLKRRHRRENDLSLLHHQCCLESTLPCWQKTSPRMVSEEDMQGSSSDSTTNTTGNVQDSCTADASTNNGSLKRRNSQLKRPISSMCLPDLEKDSSSQQENNKEASTTTSCCLLTPKSRAQVPEHILTTPSCDETSSVCLLSPSDSPWGQFVEMIAPSPEYSSGGGGYISSDDYSSSSPSPSSSIYPVKQFLPFCLHPEYDKQRSLFNPYPTGGGGGRQSLFNTKRRRLPSVQMTDFSSSFLLQVPTHQDPMLDEAEGALRGLSF